MKDNSLDTFSEREAVPETPLKLLPLGYFPHSAV
jgi:hypothetical protein